MTFRDVALFRPMKSPLASPVVAKISITPRGFSACAGLLLMVVGLLFFESCKPGIVLFANDGPLGANVAEQFHMPGAFTGVWQTLNWVGGFSGSSAPNLTNALLWTLGPVGFAKFYAPFSILVLGLCAWLAFRQQRFSPAASVTGALAAALNGGFFSYACWGLGTLTLTIASFFLALAAWGVEPEKRSWSRVVLAGFAIGLGIMEGFDNGAILSVFFAAYVIVRTWVENPGHPAKLVGGVTRLAVIAIMAAVFAWQALFSLITTQVQGVVGMAQDEATKKQRWAEATMWSLPKSETLRLFVAGLYGYRLDTPNGGAYWGAVGRHPAWEQFLAQENLDPNQARELNPAGLRHSGSGFYCGVFVCLLALWAIFRSLGNRGDLYRPDERRLIWFWAAVAFGSLLLSWGKHAPFYAIAYELPYFSTIRNPIKFLHPLNIALVILFAYGVEGLWRAWERQTTAGDGVKRRFANWWGRAAGFDRHWIVGSLVIVGFSLMLALLYSSAKGEMLKFLMLVGYGDTATATAVFWHSVFEIGWYLLFLVASVGLIVLMMSGALRRTGAGTIGFVLLLAVTGLDLARSNLPWINHFNYETRYARTPLYDTLASKPWEGRAQMLPGILLQQQFASVQEKIRPEELQQLSQMFGSLAGAYGAEWVQHQFQYYGIQSLDIVQEPRPTVENSLYRANFPQHDPAAQLRLARLTNSRYFIGFGSAPLLAVLNQLAAGTGEFRDVMPLWAAMVEGFVRPTQDGKSPFSLIEYTGALPRAHLYANWQVEPNPTNTLQRLAAPEFDPAKLVLVAGDCPAPANPDATDAGTVEITDYHPKLVRMKAGAKVPSVLLFNDKHDPNWKVSVDGQPAVLLKANYLMRGVHLAPGGHEIVWRFQPPTEGLYVSLGAIVAGFILVGLNFRSSRKELAPAK